MWCTIDDYDDHEKRVTEERSEGIESAVEFARRRLGFEPDERQTAVLASSAKRGILNCTRQWGKSTVAAIKAVHKAHAAAGSLVVAASPTERQSGEFLRKASTYLHK